MSENPWNIWSKPVIGWIAFDGANTVFSLAVITRYFNDWIIDANGRPDWQIGLMGFCASALLVMLLPVLGGIGDATGRRKPIMLCAVALSVTMTALLGFVSSITLALVIAGLAIVGFQAALAQYDPLLANVAPEPRRGLVSGLGVGFGYFGVLIALGIFGLLVGDDPQSAFIPTAIIFALGSIPCFLWVKEGPGNRLDKLSVVASGARTDLAHAIDTARRTSFGRLLVARFLYSDAVLTVVAYLSIYAKRVGGLNDAQVNILLAFSVIFSIVGAVVAGWLAGRFGAARVTRMTVLLIVVTLLTGSIFGSFGLWLLGPLVGICLGSINSCDRVLALLLAPEEQRGALFGLNALVGKISSGVGPLILWGGTVALASALGASLASASRIALVSLAVSALVGWIILGPLASRERNGTLYAEDGSNKTLTDEDGPAKTA